MTLTLWDIIVIALACQLWTSIVQGTAYWLVYVRKKQG